MPNERFHTTLIWTLSDYLYCLTGSDTVLPSRTSSPVPQSPSLFLWSSLLIEAHSSSQLCPNDCANYPGVSKLPRHPTIKLQKLRSNAGITLSTRQSFVMRTTHWVIILPAILQGLRYSFKGDLDASSAEIAFGTPLRLPKSTWMTALILTLSSKKIDNM